MCLSGDSLNYNHFQSNMLFIHAHFAEPTTTGHYYSTYSWYPHLNYNLNSTKQALYRITNIAGPSLTLIQAQVSHQQHSSNHIYYFNYCTPHTWTLEALQVG